MKMAGKVWAMVPFFYAGGKPEVHKKYLQQTVEDLRRSGMDGIVVVDDGSPGNLDLTGLCCDELVVHESNFGKSAAVRTGLNRVFDIAGEGCGLVVQCDYDADQDPADVRVLLARLREPMEGRGADLVIGDRYAQAQPDPLPYRKVMLELQRALCKAVGYDVQDTVSGLRAFTGAFGRQVLESSRSRGFGIDIEELVIARLYDLRVEAVPLTSARQRGGSTLDHKLLDVFDGVQHSEALEAKGLGVVVGVLRELHEKMSEGRDRFELDLSVLGVAKTVCFLRKESGVGYGYTAKFRHPSGR